MTQPNLYLALDKQARPRMLRVRLPMMVVTPMFLRGSKQEDAEGKGIGQPEWRGASLKGALRFWWRALNWAPIREGKEASDKLSADDVALNELHLRESQLFGHAADAKAAALEADRKSKSPEHAVDSKETAFQAARVRVQLRPGAGIPQTVKAPENIKKLPGKPRSGTQYLLGQGLFQEDLEQPAMAAGTPFEIVLEVLLSRPADGKQDQMLQRAVGDLDSALRAAAALSLLGGLGARTRRGVGSVALRGPIELSDGLVWASGEPLWASPVKSKEAYVQSVQALLKPALSTGVSEPSFSAIWAGVWIDLVDWGDKPSSDSAISSVAETAMDRTGRQFGLYRSYGREGEAFGVGALKRFSSDHDLLLGQSAEGDRKHPKRVVFGLPHNYYFSSKKEKFNINWVSEKLERKPLEKPENNRRASPLAFHFHWIDGCCIEVRMFWTAKFLPTDACIHIKSKSSDKVPFHAKEAMKPITEFLNEQRSLLEGRDKERLGKFKVISIHRPSASPAVSTTPKSPSAPRS